MGGSKPKETWPILVRMRMRSRRDAVGPTLERILKTLSPVGFSPGQLDDFAVAITEALSNAAVHGNRLDPRSHVSVRVEVEPGRRATVDVKDGGPGFDAHGLSDPTESDNILVPGGRGVFLMRRLVDEVSFSGSGNRVRLTKRR
jgi:serine/threonine-protein kinase RsbW